MIQRSPNRALWLASASFIPLISAASFDVRVTPFFRENPPLGQVTNINPGWITGVVAGDTINFLINSTGFAAEGPWNQTLLQGSFDPPCQPLPGGFTTGLVQLPGNGQERHPFVLPQDYNGSALWFYTEEHCGNGGVFSVNAAEEPDERSFEAYRHIAKLRNSTRFPSGLRTPGASIPPSQTSIPSLAWPNDTFTFHISAFQAGKENLTITQSSLSDPCNPLITEDGSVGWSSRTSGFADSPLSTRDIKVELPINDTDTIWGYVEGHCREGQIWAINPPGEKTLAAFVERARSSPNESSIFSIEPEPIPEEDGAAGSLLPDSRTWWLPSVLVALLLSILAVV